MRDKETVHSELNNFLLVFIFHRKVQSADEQFNVILNIVFWQNGISVMMLCLGGLGASIIEVKKDSVYAFLHLSFASHFCFDLLLLLG